MKIKWNNMNTGFKFDEIYNELFCDIIGILWLEDYLFNTVEGKSLDPDSKFSVIKNSYGWNCDYPNSAIEKGHPHHSLRVNLLLISEKIHNFLCSYPHDKLVKFEKTSNPACKPDAVYLTQSEYYMKYMKYKNKYLALKKLLK